jgi:hypothetical protein
MEYSTEQENFIEATKAPEGFYWTFGGKDLGFSPRSCDCCGSKLAGDRFEASLVSQAGKDQMKHEVIERSVCTDCIMYIANGDIPETWEG